jgi:nucleoside-diphosphate-sugar epimerase
MPNRILVTGASGFLGSAVIPRMLTRGEEVVGLDPAAPQNPRVRHIVDDLSDPARIRALLIAERVTHVIHAGGISGPMVMQDRPDRVMAINVGGSLNLLLAAIDTGVTTLIYCSSVSAIGDFYQADPIGDDHPMRPTTPYGCSKAAMDMVLRGLWRTTPLDLCSLRFTGIYGPGRRTSFVIGEIVDAAVAERPARVEAMSDQPFLYIDDAADAAVAACLSERRRQLHYFIAYPEQVALADVAAAAAAAGAPVGIEVDPTRPPARRGSVDITPAIRDFGFAPKVDHRAGIARMITARRGITYLPSPAPTL